MILKETRTKRSGCDVKLSESNNSFRGVNMICKIVNECGNKSQRAYRVQLLQLLAATLLLTVFSHDKLFVQSSDVQLLSSSSILKRDLSQTRQQANEQQIASSSIKRSNVCQVSNGESVAIVEIEESRGSEMSQNTNPLELPISGSVSRGEIELKIESETHKYFQIQDKRLKLTRPLDRDAVLRENSTQIMQQPISSIYLQISCFDKRQDEHLIGQKARKVIIPVLVKVLDLNDNAPKFSSQVYTVQVDELTAPETIILDSISAIDVDSANNGLIEYSLVAPPVASQRQRLVQRAEPKLEQTTLNPTINYSTTSTETAQDSSTTVRTPTINLNSEPIVNGPMEEADEEESDESLLASINSTYSDSDSDSMALMGRRAGARKRKKRAGLWTNLLAGSASGDDLSFRAADLEMSSEEESGLFALELAPNSNKPLLRLKRPLDYETKRVHLLTIRAIDRANNPNERLSSQAQILVRVLDGDDQPPAFVLDQSGCATGPMISTTMAPQQRLRRQLIAEDTRRPLNGFKISEENFEFGDTSSGDEPEEHLLRLLQTDGQTVSSRTRRFQTTLAPQQSKQSPYSADYSCLSGLQTNGQAEYFATVMSGDSDYLLRIRPQAIRARDRDELNANIKYTFVNGTPANYTNHFQINPLDATIKQVAPVERAQVANFVIWIQAQEQTVNKFSSVAKLTIEVLPSDKNPPILVPNSYTGFVEENAPIGTNVLVSNQANSTVPMRINVLDADYSSRISNQLYEFETTSDAFKVNKDGLVYVNKWPLDRDVANQAVHMFQVTARQLGLASSRSISSPVSLNVSLLDLNDNAPIISNNSLLPIQMVADGRASRLIATIEAIDKDSAENSIAHFSILHVSNNGKDRFRLDSQSGKLEALGKFVAGEQFSLTLQVTDELSRASQSILEVQVTPGPNTGGPQFVMPDSEADPSRGFTLEVSEGVAPHAALLQLTAIDPDNNPITYNIVDGNTNGDFQINSKSGLISVANKLDREEVSAYHLLVQARDSGGLATNRPLIITVLDVNDQNPQFGQAGYTFAVPEGVANRVLGRVSATDGDAGENGQISYLLNVSPGEVGSLFEIDPSTGDITLLRPLDFEKARSHALLVTAKDHGENPRSSTVSVLIKVLDAQDEPPYFERSHLETRVMENLANERLVQVEARDLDSEAQITYVLKSGDPSLFSVDAISGIVSTGSRGLDFEEAQSYTILIGTLEHQDLESQQEQRSAVCRVDISVLDANDHAPQFVSQPLPVRIQDSAQLGTIVAKLEARDGDASEPNNQVRYELIVGRGPQTTNERCAHAFMVDATSGAVSVKADLRRDSQSECHLWIKARDLASQQNSLSSLESLTIFIDHIAEISPASMIAFADSQFTLELEENSKPNSLVKVLPIVNKPKINFPISCEIVSGNELSKFYVIENEQRDCELKTRDSVIDYEQKQRYSLTLKLNTIGSSSKTLAQVNINILDKNDNRPYFHRPSRYSHLTQNRFLAAIASDAPSETQVLQVRATDLDSPISNGLLSYEILNEQELESRFKVDPLDGMVRTSRPVEDVPATRLPMRIKLLARDNPISASESLDSTAELVVNLIEDKHRIALVLKDTTTGRALDNKDELLSVIQERTGLISGLEKAESLKIQRNGSIEADVSGTDFWFYLIEPGTLRIVSSEDIRVRGALLDQRAQSSLLDMIGQNLGFTKARVRLPYSLSSNLASRSSSIASSSRSLMGKASNLASILILTALFIAIISAIVLVYQCGSWSSYSRAAKEKLYAQQQQQSYYPYAGINCSKSMTGSQNDFAIHSALNTFAGQHPLLSSNRSKLADDGAIYQLDAPTASIATLSKEYETQMLKMSVLFDDSHSVDEKNLNENNISQNLT